MVIPLIQQTSFYVNLVTTQTTVGGDRPQFLPGSTLPLVVGSIHMACQLQ